MGNLVNRQFAIYGHFTSRCAHSTNSLNSIANKHGYDGPRLDPVIGLEVHTQLNSQTKLFSSASTHSSELPTNSCVALFDMATPGTLPRLNHACLQRSLVAGLLLNCEIPPYCRFDRKHYFYPDLPLGYQITQKDFPIARNGHLDFYVCSGSIYADQQKEYNDLSSASPSYYIKRLAIQRIQLEMDSGRTVRHRNHDLIDLNRSGVALIEVVTEPCLHSSIEAACFVDQLRLLFVHGGVCTGEMHRGQLRVDANISITIDGLPGAKTELKNLNSLRHLARAIDHELSRQRSVLLSGGKISEETREVDDETGQTVSSRLKGAEFDYRFLPEPNLPMLSIDKAWLTEAEASVLTLKNTPMPHQLYINTYKFSPSFALQLIRDEELQAFINKCFEFCPDGLPFNSLLIWLRELRMLSDKIEGLHYPPLPDSYLVKHFAQLVSMESQGRITKHTCLDLLRRFATHPMEEMENTKEESGTIQYRNSNDSGVLAVIERECLWRIDEEHEMQKTVADAFAENPELVRRVLVLWKSTQQSGVLAGPGNKHFNRLRTAVQTRCNKRIAIADIELIMLRQLKIMMNNLNYK